jgi:hypothetical protein
MLRACSRSPTPPTSPQLGRFLNETDPCGRQIQGQQVVGHVGQVFECADVCCLLGVQRDFVPSRLHNLRGFLFVDILMTGGRRTHEDDCPSHLNPAPVHLEAVPCPGLSAPLRAGRRPACKNRTVFLPVALPTRSRQSCQTGFLAA